MFYCRQWLHFYPCASCISSQPFQHSGGILKRQLEGIHVKNENEGAGRDVISPTELTSNKNPKWPVTVAFLNFSGAGWTEDIWCFFKVKLPCSNTFGVEWTSQAFLMYTYACDWERTNCLAMSLWKRMSSFKIKYNQTRSTNGDMFGHQATFDRVLSPSILCMCLYVSRLGRGSYGYVKPA